MKKKAETWNALKGSYPDLAQLRTNSLSPTDIDTAGGEAGPIEAKLSSPDVAMGAELDVVRANKGKTVFYEPCWNGYKLSGGTISYWNFQDNIAIDLNIGSCS